MTSQELAKRVKRWQKRLRLQDWDLTVKFTSDLRDDQGQKLDGYCEPVELDKTATIQLDPMLANVELILVHELLHIHLLPFDSPLEVTQQEATINVLAALLTKLYPPKRRTPPSEGGEGDKNGSIQNTTVI